MTAMTKKRDKRLKPIRAWAVVGKGGVVILDHHLRPMLIFNRHWRAEGALYGLGEKVVRVTIAFDADENTP